MAESGSPAPPAVFSVWAPRPDRVRLDVDGALYPMDPADDGWWRTDVDARPDARYGFVLEETAYVLKSELIMRWRKPAAKAITPVVEERKTGTAD